MSHTLGRARGSFCLGPSGPPRQALPQPYQDMTLLRTLPLWQPGFQQQFCLLGPQELGDLACGRAACWETGPAMEVNSCPRSVVCMGLGGLGSSTGPVRRSGVDLGRRALLRTRGYLGVSQLFCPWYLRFPSVPRLNDPITLIEEDGIREQTFCLEKAE